MAALAEPQHRLPAAARSYWRAAIALQSLYVVPVALVLGPGASSIGLPFWLPLAVALVVEVPVAVLVPEIRWRRWRYEIRDDEIDLRHGVWTVRRTLVPIRRVQHVETTSGPLQQRFGLANVVFHTAAGGSEIPALSHEEAEAVRRRVGELARTRDDV